MIFNFCHWWSAVVFVDEVHVQAGIVKRSGKRYPQADEIH